MSIDIRGCVPVATRCYPPHVKKKNTLYLPIISTCGCHSFVHNFSFKVNYKKNMPDIELLMEAWPPEVEEIIENVNVLTPELDIPLENYARMVSGP